MKTPIRVALTMAIFAFASSASAQQPWTLELRGGAAFPTVDMNGDLGTGNGMVLEGNVSYSFLPYLGAYVGWDYMLFTPDESFAGDDIDFEETGYVAGLLYQRAISEAVPFDVWTRVGARYDHLELEDAAGEIVAGTDRELGFEVGLGVAVEFGERWAVSPGVRYRAVTHDVEIGVNDVEEAELRHVVADIGVSYRF